MDGFRRSDHQVVLECLTDDVVWVIHGVRTTHGKAEFDLEIENPGFRGSPELAVDSTVVGTLDGADAVVTTGIGKGALWDGGTFTFAFSTHFTLRDGLIARVESFVVPLT